MLCSSLLWIRWRIKMSSGKFYATCQKQESRHTKHLETLSGHRILVQFEARSTKRTANLTNYDTLPAEFIDKAICMETKDPLYQRDSVILRPRVVLKANCKVGSQDLLVQEARSLWGSQQDAARLAERFSATWNGEAETRGSNGLCRRSKEDRARKKCGKATPWFGRETKQSGR